MKGKKVLIVGGSSGVGLALAKQVKVHGAEVIIASKSAAQKQASLGKQHQLAQCRFVSFDITEAAEIQRLLDEVGDLDHLAITVKSPLVVAPFLELDMDDVRHAFETKLWGQYAMAKMAVEQLRQNGSIIFSSGTLGHRPHLGYSTLSIINGAVESLTKALSLELAPIRVNAVCPGFKTLKTLEEKIPLGLGLDAQMANAYWFLMNDSYTTGTTLVTDGGARLV